MKKTKMSIRKKMDKRWSELVKERAGYKCEKCGTKKKRLHSHHIMGRRILQTRWYLPNGMCLCSSCHKFSVKFSAHETPLLYVFWVLEKRGTMWLTKLMNKFKKKKKYSLEDYIKMYKGLNR